MLHHVCEEDTSHLEHGAEERLMQYTFIPDVCLHTALDLNFNTVYMFYVLPRLADLSRVEHRLMTGETNGDDEEGRPFSRNDGM